MMYQRRLVTWIPRAVILLACLFNLYYLAEDVRPRMKEALLGLRFSYDEKMEHSWGSYYQQMVFIREHTESDATIMIPPQSKQHSRIGNMGLDDYFLLPRNLVAGHQLILEQRDDIDYVVVHLEFPDFEVEGTRIMLDEDFGLIVLEGHE